MSHIRESRPNSGLGFSKPFQLSPLRPEHARPKQCAPLFAAEDAEDLIGTIQGWVAGLGPPPHPTPYTPHPTPYNLHPTPYTLHLTPHTLHPAPCTLHPIHFTLNPTPCTPHSASQTLRLHAKPSTLHPTPYTPNPNFNTQILNSQLLAT